jgi:UDP-2,3-diacylglucosamine hydrolase
MSADKNNPDWSHLGIVAGGGDLPMVLARQAIAKAKQISIVRLSGFADQDWSGFPSREFAIQDMAAMGQYFHDVGVDAVTFAGNVRRPDFDDFTLKNTPATAQKSLQNAARQGDDALLRRVISIFESAGFVVLGLDAIAPDHLAQTGIMGNQQACNQAQEDCQRASEIARKIGALDIGQSAVVCKGIVLAVEAQEGTEQMLARCAELPAVLRGTAAQRCGVFAKWAKPGQDRRIDLPVVGVSTIEAVANAGLAGLVLEAGAVMILDPEGVKSAVERLGLFLLGVKAGG